MAKSSRMRYIEMLLVVSFLFFDVLYTLVIPAMTGESFCDEKNHPAYAR